MKKILAFAAGVTVVGVVIAWATIGLAADKVNYSGKYSADRPTVKSGVETDSTLEVVHNENGIVVTRVELGKTTTSHCPLKGSVGDYTSPSGVSGKCKAKLKAKYLTLESVMVARPQPTASVRMHTKERWRLSANSKSLTIKVRSGFSRFPFEYIIRSCGLLVGSEEYTRTGTRSA